MPPRTMWEFPTPPGSPGSSRWIPASPRTFRCSRQYAVRLSVSAFNLTNHFNPEAVHSNVDDPAFGYFFGHRGRRFTLDFDVLF